MGDVLTRVVAWKNLLINGADYCALWRTAEGWLLRGTVVGVLKDQRPVLANYEISCDEHWFTHRVEVNRIAGNETKALSLSVESRGVWRASGKELPGLRGCHDVDLAVTPATNTLPSTAYCGAFGSGVAARVVISPLFEGTGRPPV